MSTAKPSSAKRLTPDSIERVLAEVHERTMISRGRWRPRQSRQDGRTLRAERTRQALVDALLGLLDEGHPSPTAAEVAERAGVSERSVFQHFADREALLEAVARQQYERVMVRRCGRWMRACRSPSGSSGSPRQRARLYELIGGVPRAALLVEHESPAVAGWLTTARQGEGRRGRARLPPRARGDPARRARAAARRARGRLRLDGLGELAHPPAPRRGPRPRRHGRRDRGATRRPALTRAPRSPARCARSAPPSSRVRGPRRS